MELNKMNRHLNYPDTSGPAGSAAPSDAPVTPFSEASSRAPGDEAAAGTEGTGEGLCRGCGGSGITAGASCVSCNGTGKVTVGIGGA